MTISKDTYQKPLVFNTFHRKLAKTYGQVLIGIELTHQNDLKRIIDNLKLYGFQYKYVNDDELLMSYLI